MSRWKRKKIKSYPKNAAWHFVQRIRTGVPIPGRMLLVTADNGTLFTFSTAFKSSFVSELPYCGQCPPKILNLVFHLVSMAGINVLVHQLTPSKRCRSDGACKYFVLLLRLRRTDGA
jgi:hypothetical protein